MLLVELVETLPVMENVGGKGMVCVAVHPHAHGLIVPKELG